MRILSSYRFAWFSALLIVVLVAGFFWRTRAPSVNIAQPSASELRVLAGEGEDVYKAAGCASCHTRDEDSTPELAGGDPLETPFGVFYAPNITPHPEAGYS